MRSNSSTFTSVTGVLLFFTAALFPTGVSAGENQKALRSVGSAKTVQDSASGSWILFSPNNIQAYLESNGVLFNNPNNGAPGLIWPNGSGKTAVFTAGLWIVGKSSADTLLHSAVVHYQTEFQPGPISGTYSGDTTTIPSITSPYDPRWNVMTLSKSTPATDSTYQLWASGAIPGAPRTADGKPNIIGDRAAYWVMNDLYMQGRYWTSKTTPMGLEVQNYFYGSGGAGEIGNVFFMRMLVINKSTMRYDSTYVGFFADTDLGDSNDDDTGCDSIRNLGYDYNGGAKDATYGVACPAIGFDLLEGPRVPSAAGDSAFYNGIWKKGFRNLGMTAFSKIINSTVTYSDPIFGSLEYAREARNLLMGLNVFSGAPNIGPFGPDEYVDSGDPVAGTGWLSSFDYVPADVRVIIPSGPFTLQPGDTQEVVVACIIGSGSDRLNSVTVLRSLADSVRQSFYATFPTLTSVEVAESRTSPMDFSLSQNYPNPFNPATVISYQLAVNSFVTVQIFDVLGRQAASLVNERQAAGGHSVRFDGTNLPSGVYFYRLQAGSFVDTRKLMLLK